MMKFIALLLILLITLPVSPTSYQENVSVEMVQVFLSARDSDQHFITDLRPEDIAIHEDGQVQKILDFTNFSKNQNIEEAPPLTVAFSMDISASMAGLNSSKEKKIELAKQAALSIVSELQPRDRMTVFGFHYLPKIIVPMTSDVSLIQAKLATQKPEEQETALFDSLYIIVEQLQKETGRKIIVLGSDGVDTSSHVKFEKLIEALKASDVTLFAFGMDSKDPSMKDGRYALNKLADATGGYAFFPRTDKDLGEIVMKIRKIIRSQYSVWYTPSNTVRDGGWRAIDITCRRPGVELRYRKGYYSSEAGDMMAASP